MPRMLASVALLVIQERVADWPAVMSAGETVILAVGAGAGAGGGGGGAAATVFLWHPLTTRSGRPYEQQFMAAAQFAYRRYQFLPGQRYGVKWMRNYFLSNDGFSETGLHGTQSILRAMIPEFRDLGPGEHPFSGYKQVRQMDTMLVEPPIYLAAMLDEVMLAGGRIVVRELPDRAAVSALPEKLVFNCTGLGAKALFGDEELTPLKGQLTFLLPQPEVQYAVLAGELYMFPRSDGILLGGTHEAGVWSLEPDMAKKREIVAGHAALFNSFKACKA